MPRSSAPHARPAHHEGALDALRAAAAPHLPLPGLGPARYAAGHAQFEARSDQRRLLTSFLRDRLARRAGSPVRVLSIGCGDGTVDVDLAAGLAGRGAAVDYDGIEPYEGSAAAWRDRLAAVPGVRSGLQQCTFDDSEPSGPYDVVTFVHSLYYVPDVPAALDRAVRLLAPGGELVVLHAPRAELNALVEVLAPRSAGHPQWFSDTVTGALRRAGLACAQHRLHARLDLTGCPDAVLDFTVQAVLPPELLAPVRAALAGSRLEPDGLVVPHPLDAFVVPAPG